MIFSNGNRNDHRRFWNCQFKKENYRNLFSSINFLIKIHLQKGFEVQKWNTKKDNGNEMVCLFFMILWNIYVVFFPISLYQLKSETKVPQVYISSFDYHIYHVSYSEFLFSSLQNQLTSGQWVNTFLKPWLQLTSSGEVWMWKGSFML